MTTFLTGLMAGFWLAVALLLGLACIAARIFMREWR